MLPKLAVLDDLEWRNCHYFCVILPNLVAFGQLCKSG